MASYSCGSIGGGPSQNSGSSGSSKQQLIIDQRKRKRMISNRESARRSRVRKLKHLDDLTAQLSHLGAKNGRLAAAIGAAAQLYHALEAENSVLRAQAAELTHRLESLNEIIRFVNSGSFFPEDGALVASDGGFMMNNNNTNPWSESILFATQPLIGPADILMY